ncbi:uncharacterized protein [Coffea arabica]|uniref:RING-type E3 ubiquitin transferase n=1 Tax=Coffea arabica TaxID=13443 RepID=A0ABM4UYX9_COFAR
MIHGEPEFTSRYCHRRTPQTASSGNAVAQAVPGSPSLPSGVDHKLLETIPIIAYSSTKQQGGDHSLFRVDQSECVVCLGALEQGEMVRLLPNCRHAFHVPCIDEWFVAHASCPVCRSPIVAPAATVNDDIPPSPPPPLQVFTSSSSFDVGSSRVEFPGQDYGNDASSSSSSSSSSGSFGLLRHSGSLVLLPTERASSSARVITGLKRSLSMDQSSVIIEMQGESSTDDDDAATTTVGAFRSVRHFDRVSAKFLSSFSRLRLGNNNEILPY